MKFYKAIVVLAGVCLIASCGLSNKQVTNTSPSSPAGPSNAASDGQVFTAQVNGQPFAGKNIHATVTTIAGKPFFNITAFSHDVNYSGPNKSENLGFNVEGEIKVGDYQFGESGNAQAGDPRHSHGAYHVGSPENDMPPETIYRITAGKLSITKYDDKTKTAAGTFALTVVNKDGKTIKIENGQFSNVAF